MFNAKLGTCCIITDGGKLVTKKGVQGIEYPGRANTTIGTLKKATMQNGNTSYRKLTDKVNDNINALHTCLVTIASGPDYQKFFRVGSSLLPWFDCEEFLHFYDDTLRHKIQIKLARCRKVIEENDIRITTHPDQYCIVDSLNPDVRKRSILTLKYHKYFMEQLTSPEEGGCINVHLHGKLGSIPEIDEIRNAGLIDWVTFENDDKGSGDHDYVLDICKRYGFRYVHDFHHHWCQTGTYFTPESPEFMDIMNTWPEDQIPKCHISQSASASNIRKHSDFINDPKLVQLIRDFSTYVDFAVEAKAKNIAVKDLYERIISK